MHVLILLVPTILVACATEQKPMAAASQPIQTIGYAGNTYRLAAGKASASDLSIELSYSISNGQAYVEAVHIDGVEYRANCPGAAFVGEQDPEVPESRGPSVPHYDNCDDVPAGAGDRDIDYTCNQLSFPEFATAPRIPIDDNLRERFNTATLIEVPPEPFNGQRFSTNTYILHPDEDYFFRLEIDQGQGFIVATEGLTDTYGELFYDNNGTIEFITGTGEWADRGNFAIHQENLDAGTYYVRVSSDDSETGSFLVYTIPY